MPIDQAWMKVIFYGLDFPEKYEKLDETTWADLNLILNQFERNGTTYDALFECPILSTANWQARAWWYFSVGILSIICMKICKKKTW